MKSTIVKGALALSVLGFTFGSSIVYDSHSEAGQWTPSIFRTIANAVEFEALTEENLQVEFDKLKEMVNSSKESNQAFSTKLDSQETSFSELIKMRDEELAAVKDQHMTAFTRSGDFTEFFADKADHALKGDFEALSQDIGEIETQTHMASLNDKIELAQEKELLEQKAAIAVANERICENKGLLEDIKGKLAQLLKDKEEVVVAVEAEEESNEEDGFSADVLTYSDFFAHIQRQQNSFFEVSPPSMLAPTNNSMSMLMMMSLMNNRQFAAPRSQVNTYHIGNGFSGGFPGGGYYGGFPGSFNSELELPSQDFSMRNPAANNSMPRLMPSFGGTDYTQTIPRVHRGDGMQGSFNF